MTKNIVRNGDFADPVSGISLSTPAAPQAAPGAKATEAQLFAVFLPSKILDSSATTRFQKALLDVVPGATLLKGVGFWRGQTEDTAIYLVLVPRDRSEEFRRTVEGAARDLWRGLATNPEERQEVILTVSGPLRLVEIGQLEDPHLATVDPPSEGRRDRSQDQRTPGPQEGGNLATRTAA